MTEHIYQTDSIMKKDNNYNHNHYQPMIR